MIGSCAGLKALEHWRVLLGLSRGGVDGIGGMGGIGEGRRRRSVYSRVPGPAPDAPPPTFSDLMRHEVQREKQGKQASSKPKKGKKRRTEAGPTRRRRSSSRHLLRLRPRLRPRLRLHFVLRFPTYPSNNGMGDTSDDDKGSFNDDDDDDDAFFARSKKSRPQSPQPRHKSGRVSDDEKDDEDEFFSPENASSVSPPKKKHAPSNMKDVFSTILRTKMSCFSQLTNINRSRVVTNGVSGERGIPRGWPSASSSSSFSSSSSSSSARRVVVDLTDSP